MPTLPSDVPAITDLQSMLPPVPRATGAHPRREMRYSTIYQESGPTSVECAVESTDPHASHLCPLVVDIRVEDAQGEIISLAPSCLSIRWERSLDPLQSEKSFALVTQSENRLFHPTLADVDAHVRAVVEVQSKGSKGQVSQPTTSVKIALDLDVRAAVEANLASRCAIFKVASVCSRFKDNKALVVLTSSHVALRAMHNPPVCRCRLDESALSCVLNMQDHRQFYLFVPNDPVPYIFQAGTISERDIIVLTIQLFIDIERSTKVS